MFECRPIFSGVLSALAWMFAVSTALSGSCSRFQASYGAALRIICIYIFMLLGQNYRHIASMHPGRDSIITFCQTSSRKGSLSRCRPPYFHLSLICFLDKPDVYFKGSERACELNSTLGISYSFSFDSPECSLAFLVIVFRTDFHNKPF